MRTLEVALRLLGKLREQIFSLQNLRSHLQTEYSENYSAYITGLSQVPQEIILQSYFINYKMLYKYKVPLIPVLMAKG